MDVDTVRSSYASLPGRLDRARRVSGRPLTLTGIEALHTTTREQLVWSPMDLATGGKAGLADVKLAPDDTPGVAPDDTPAKPGKDKR